MDRILEAHLEAIAHLSSYVSPDTFTNDDLIDRIIREEVATNEKLNREGIQKLKYDSLTTDLTGRLEQWLSNLGETAKH